MKNKLMNLLFLLCLLLGFTDVYAYDKDTIFTRYESGRFSIPNFSYGNDAAGWKDYTSYIYYAQNNEDASETYFVYCADPGLAAWELLKVDHILMGAESSTKAEDYGILTILKNGKWEYTGNPGTQEEQLEYEATSMAVRMFINGIVGWNYRHKETNIFPAFIGTTYEWVESDEEMKEAYKIITGKESSRILSNFGYSAGSIKVLRFGDTAFGDKVKSYLKQGMLAAASYKKEEVLLPEIKAQTSGGSEVTETANGSSTTYERVVIASLGAKNFTLEGSNPGYLYYKGFEAKSSNMTVQELGYSLEKTDDESAYQPLSQNVNIAQLLKDNGKEEIYIAFKITLTTDNSECNAKFDLKYEYADQKLLSGAMLYPKNDAGKDYTNAQRFVMYSDGPIEDSLELNAKMCDSYCSPTIGLPQICNDDVDPSTIDENGNVEYEFREAYKNDSYEIDKCILNNSDAAGNPYKLVDNEYAGIVASNPYCTISCKEDYLFTVPYKRNVDNGRYFRISMAMKGQQDCYSSKLDTESFNKDMIQAQMDLVDSYNKWLQNKQLVEAYEALSAGGSPLIANGDYAECQKRNCTRETLTVEQILNGEEADCISTIEDSGDKTPIKEFRHSGTFYQINLSNGAVSPTSTLMHYSGEVKLGTASGQAQEMNLSFGKIGEDYNIGTCNDDTCVCEDYKCELITAEDDFKEYIETNNIQQEYESSKEKLDNAIENLKKIIDQYNGCMADHNYEEVSTEIKEAHWDMIYHYEPEITYSYKEPNPQDYDGNKWIDEVKSLSCDENNCDVMVGIDEKVYAEKCDTDDDKCQSVTSVTTIFDENNVPTTEYCKDGNLNEKTYECSSPESTVTYDTKLYFMCETTDGENYTCNTAEPYKVTNLSYVHKVATSEGTYDTPRVYYSVVPSGGIEISTTEIENAYLVDGLPVGASTPPGTYFYLLSLNNIGTYYSNQQLGRIFGTKPTSLTTVERLEGEETINGDELKGNEYACIYTVTQTCTDDAGVVHDPEECAPGEDWNICKQRLCPNSSGYCVKEAESYYVCTHQYYADGECQKYDSRDAAISASSENYNCCPDCQVICVGNCIYDLDRYPYDPGDLNLDFRPITPSEINPNNRPLGYNWDSQNPTNVLVAEKAGNTISEIESRADLDVNDDVAVQELDEYTLKVTMTPVMATWIKEKNADAEQSGSYSNETLECYDYTLSGGYDETSCKSAGYSWSDDNCVMANIFCYSTFISDLSAAFANDVDAPKRDIAINDARSNYAMYSKISELPNQTHTIVTNDYWTIYTYSNLDVNGDEIPDIGPAWK